MFRLQVHVFSPSVLSIMLLGLSRELVFCSVNFSFRISFWFSFISSICWDFLVIYSFQVFVIARWSLFYDGCFKFSSDIPTSAFSQHLCIILSDSSLDLLGSWYNEWFFFYCLGYLGHYVVKFWILFKSFVLVGLHLNILQSLST